MKKAILSILACTAFAAVAAETPVLEIESGKIIGVPTDTGCAIVYKGIPYAAPPVGNLRWRKPRPVEPWKGVRKCEKFGPASMQGDQDKRSFYYREFFSDGDPERSEDCLYLNVWTPAAGSSLARLPVMLWIHGGAFSGGFGHEMEFDGEAFARRDVILVTINYRLGMCGFMAHPQLTAENDGNGSGNYGLFDQLAALQWVKKNIRAFGGDPDNITVFGQSAGACSVQALISSPLTAGLISKAIIQSGGGLNGPLAAMPRAELEKVNEELWNLAGMTMLEEMRACPPERFGEVVSAYGKSKGGSVHPFWMTVDGELLTRPLTEAALAGGQLDIPYMIGYNKNDMSPEAMKKAAVNWSLLLEKQGRTPAYVYAFTRELPSYPDELKMEGDDKTGAFHSAELWYVFGTLKRSRRQFTAADYDLSERMVTYWTNFAKSGSPNGDGIPAWKPCVNEDRHIQILDVTD